MLFSLQYIMYFYSYLFFQNREYQQPVYRHYTEFSDTESVDNNETVRLLAIVFISIEIWNW